MDNSKMTFTTDGMRIEGLFRALQGDIMWAFGFIGLAFVALVLSWRFIGQARRNNALAPHAANSATKTANMIFAAITILALGALAWRFAAVMAINRIPRADADKSGVYQQMKKNSGEADANSPAPR